MPKPVIDIKHIRENPGLYENNCRIRNYPSISNQPWEIYSAWKDVPALQKNLMSTRQDLNRTDQKIKRWAAQKRELWAELRTSEELGVNSPGHIPESASVALDAIELLEERAISYKRQVQEAIEDQVRLEKTLIDKITSMALQQPNLTSNRTPIGDEPEIIEEIGQPRTDQATDHETIGTELGIINKEAAASFSGWGFYYLIGAGALLEQALVQFALSKAHQAGFIPVVPPSLVYTHAAWACGFQPRDEGGNKQIYVLEEDDPEDGQPKPQLALAATSEIPLAGLYMDHKFRADELPLKHVGVSRCYRAEAGSRGKDTKGLYRVHEFTKVELFSWTAPDIAEDSDAQSKAGPTRFSSTPNVSPSEDMFQSMLSLQRDILSSLNIPLRILNQPSTDLGASATIKYDIEGFFPSRTHAPWGELSSLSNCTDYQTRRLATRMHSVGQEKKFVYPYTLNGTALAVPRTLAALLENNWDAQKRVVHIPECLRKWMDDMEVISGPNSVH